MSQPPAHARDPIGWCALIVLAFLGLCLWGLGTPSKPFFDEVHYLPAARALVHGIAYLNREHPLLGKEAIALGMMILGDNAWGWRTFSALAGAIALFAFMRAMWFASLSRFSTVAFGILLASGFALFVHARIAMLDVFMVAFFAVSLWQLAAAVREPERGRLRLAGAGAALGLSMAAKWNAVPLATLPGLAFLAARLSAGRRRLFTSRRGVPVPGVSLIEAALWLGLLPLMVYAATFAPATALTNNALDPASFVAFHREIIALQESVLKPHPYQSTWTDWVLNRRAIWYLYEPVDGAQRGVLLIGNPLTMLLGLPALGWCVWIGIARRRWDALAIAILYAASLGFWIVANKPIQFYYHYFLPSCFLLAALALALDTLPRKLALVVLAGSVGMFAWFHPILSAAALAGEQSFAHWMWLDSWR